MLVLTHRVPYPPDKGDRIRTYHQLRWLSQRVLVDLACLADEPVSAESIEALSALTERHAIVPIRKQTQRLRVAGSLATGRTASEGAFRSSRLRSILREWTRNVRYDAVLISASSLLPYLALSTLRETHAVVDLVDVDSQKWLDYASATRGPLALLYRTEGNRVRRLEKRLSPSTRAVMLVSEAEAAIYRSFARHGSIHAVTNGVDLDYFRPETVDEAKRCVFVGALDYRPNIDAAIWFGREVWPQIRREHPGAELALVGRKPVAEVARLKEIPGIDVVGQVPDVRPHLARAAVAVVPLRIARGVQNKVLEALAMGKATVASPHALAGLAAKPGVHLISARTSSDWIEAVGRLFDQPQERQRLSRAGRSYAEQHHSWDKCLEPLGSLLGLRAKLPGHFPEDSSAQPSLLETSRSAKTPVAVEAL